MEKKHKIIGLLLLVGLPALLFITAPSSKATTSVKPVSDTSVAQEPISTVDIQPTPTPTDGATSTSQNTPQAKAPAQQYNYTPITPTVTPPKPATPPAAPTSAPTPWTNTSGFLVGTYHYVVTYVSTTGQETGASPVSLGVSTNNQRVWVTSLPTSTNDIVEERNLYRTLSNGSMVGPFYLVASFYDNSTTNYYDNTPDSVLSAGSPKYF